MLASERLFDAELELAATKAERTAIYEQRVSALRALEKFAEARLNAGFRATEVELLAAGGPPGGADSTSPREGRWQVNPGLGDRRF